MNARHLLAALFPSAALPNMEITSVTERADKADGTSVFVCIKGARADGHTLAPDAYARGCRLFVAEHALDLPADAQVFVTDNTRKALAELACAFYAHPSHAMHVIGITGTKGKTTTAHLLMQILEQNGIPSGYIGTTGIRYGETEIDTPNTTPDALTLQRAMSDMVASGIRVLVMEVSSQALMQHRVAGIRFETVLFTNLTPDHIGAREHPTFEHYRDTKHTLFTSFGAKNAVYNTDDASFTYMREDESADRIYLCGTGEANDYSLSHVTPTRTSCALGLAFSIRFGDSVTDATLPLIGEPNASNALLAFAVAHGIFGLPAEGIAKVLSTAAVTGRSEVVMLPNGAAVILDYAHNGESMRRILTSLRAYRPHRLIALFGSVGERSQMRRAELGLAASEYADLAILTSDNPGNESPEAIIEEIAAAMTARPIPTYKILDRAEAIRKALRMTEADDILLLAGKGHEAYQLIGNEKLPFSEHAIIEEEMRAISTATNI